MNVLLLVPELEPTEAWFRAILETSPAVKFVARGEVPDEAISVAIVDNSPQGDLCQFKNLRLIISLSSGIDTILDVRGSQHMTIARLVTPDMIALMREYICYQVLRIHREFASIEQMHREMRWEWIPAATPAMCKRILVLGLGEIGGPCAEALRDLAFQVTGWSRSQKDLRGILCLSGEDALHSALPHTDILVSLLPLTPLTKNFLSDDIFRRLPRGASIINAGRGGSLNEIDLIAALDSGHLSHATLDVFTVEPLPPDDPLWKHSKVTITPHTAAHPRLDSFIGPIAHALQLALRDKHQPAEQCSSNQ